jgi:hypothetical protein
VQAEQVVLQILRQQITALSMVLTHGLTLHQHLLQSVAVLALDMHTVMERFQTEPVPMEVTVVVRPNTHLVAQVAHQHKLLQHMPQQFMVVQVVQQLQPTINQVAVAVVPELPEPQIHPRELLVQAAQVPMIFHRGLQLSDNSVLPDISLAVVAVDPLQLQEQVEAVAVVLVVEIQIVQELQEQPIQVAVAVALPTRPVRTLAVLAEAA